jgi:anti-anti-sigma factor
MPVTASDESFYTLIKVHDKVFIRHQARRFNTVIKEALARGRSRFLVDLSACGYISSEGLAAVAELWHLCTEKPEGQVAIVCADDGENEIRYLFDIIGLSKLMEGHLFSRLYEAEKFMAGR